jgi:aspartate 1-decarboxylase
MEVFMLKSKIHRAIVTDSDLSYEGSITIDKDLLEASDILEYEKVDVVDVENGNRFTTYAIAGERGTGIVCVNGAAARLTYRGDHVIIMAYGAYRRDEAQNVKPKIVLVDQDNKMKHIGNI